MEGVDVYGISPLRRSAYQNVKQQDREIRFMELLVVVHAIQDVVRASVGATGNTKFQDTLKTLRNMVFPEWAEQDQSKNKSTQEILKREFESGPLKVQSAAYETTKQRKNTRRVRSDAKQRR